MRLTLAAFVIVIGAMIGTSAIQTVNELQDAKLQRLCNQLREHSSYDEMCKDFQ
ncbi:hypothetical protein RW01021201_074 [Synechococcus phage S-RIM8]|uniref:Uncharacterized protein n=1 Tax=Synechococcus phage S-RIM8 TaxID=756278 RepID=A0A1D7S9A7_9CAUD|nr:hypothetical protein RW01021201_074 [Synechococcus phage S-RIM8]QBQ75402.1 hypothetical protein RW030617_074 [Synechococcus phage S-RIM8]